MKKHTKLYLDYFGLHGEYVGSELSGLPAQDIHHIFARGMGGGKESDRIENLMALTRDEHNEYGDKVKYYKFLLDKHEKHLKRNGKEYDKEWFRLRGHESSGKHDSCEC